MTRFALLVAADEYVVFPPTRFCHADATLMEETLVEHCDYAAQHVLTLRLGPEAVTAPTEILEKIDSLANQSQPGDTILFFFAGHGDVHEGEPYLILPHTERDRKNQTAVPLRDISNRLRLDQRLCVRIFDACHSGHDTRDVSLDPDSFSRALMDQPATSDGWITFASCGPHELSYPDPGLGHGIFTHALCEAIRKTGSEEHVFAENLKVTVCDHVASWAAERNRRQTPTFNILMHGNVPFATRAKKKILSKVGAKGPTADVGQIESRLARIGSWRSVGSKAQRDRLAGYTIAAAEHIESLVNASSMFGAKKGFERTPQSAALVLSNGARRAILNFVRQRGLESSHHIETKIGDNESPTAMHENIVQGIALLADWTTRRPSKPIEYVVDEAGWAYSTLTVDIRGPGPLPYAQYWVYLCPLRLRAFILSGFSINGDESGTTYCFLEYESDSTQEVRRNVAHSWNELLNSYALAVESVVASLEKELAAK